MAPDLSPGEVLANRYRVQAELGAGGMGKVYRCHDLRLNRTVAIKTLRETTPDGYRRFEREARIVATLEHPGIVRLFDIGNHGRMPYLVQEYVPGIDLSAVLQQSRLSLPYPLAGDILRLTAEALDHAHSRGVIHRDIKPSNIRLLPWPSVKVLDFGVAALDRDDSRTTATGVLLGTPRYFPPEAIEGSDAVSPLSDIFSFGLVSYEVLSGHHPFSGDSAIGVLMAILSKPAPPLTASGVPRPICQLIDRCLERRPANRPASMAEIAAVFASTLGTKSRSTVRNLWPTFVPATDQGILEEPAPLSPPHAPVRERIRAAPDSSNPAASTTGLTADLDTASVTTNPAPTPPVGPMEPSPDAAISRRDEMAGRVLAQQFTLHELLARGRSGPFYKAYDRVRGELVGLKLITSADEDTQRRMIRAGRLWMALAHENLARVYEIRPDVDGFAGIIVSELIDGDPLTSLREHPQSSILQIVEIGVQLCEALAYLHDRGIIHREVRPHNIILLRDSLRVKLLDSGIARHSNPDVDAFTRTGVIVGDLAYASPELARGKADQRADLFAVGAILLELLTGERPDLFSSSATPHWLEAIAFVPPALREIVSKALDTAPDGRFSSAREFADALRAVVPAASQPPPLSGVVAVLHGIRTHAAWTRAFAEVAEDSGLHPRADRWNFGYFSVLRFLSPWSRHAKVRWFRSVYASEFPTANSSVELPSIVAHSFGSYLLGYALLRYPFLRFDKVLLCGSILPRSFPWTQLIERGQVQSVRNEYGSEDLWTRLAAWFVPGTGSSGIHGFEAQHARFEQVRFSYRHSEYFDRAHMRSEWLPFLRRTVDYWPPRKSTAPSLSRSQRPWGLYMLYAGVASALFLVARGLSGR